GGGAMSGGKRSRQPGKRPLSVFKERGVRPHLAGRAARHVRWSVGDAEWRNQIDYHLGRARMAGSANILAVKTCPGERVDRIAMAFDKVYAEREIVLVNELDSDVEVAVDTTDFDEMAGNLLENSYKWAHSLIRVHSRVVDKKWVEICIEDDGPGIDDSKLHDAVKRGVRLDETQPGTGLGLNIVSEMAHSYQGALTLSRSKLGGLSAVLRLKQPTL
ncbi:ATP-binding protein, partial [Vibrio furnissii]|uniref:ATP-binding protein n=1 Tax=Vibrio furnissii TaxID=29494 RepID=UPI001EEB8BD8